MLVALSKTACDTMLGNRFANLTQRRTRLGAAEVLGSGVDLDPAAGLVCMKWTLPLQVFVNASTSDVVATTSIEALAMGKWLICAHHPCNAFASHFANTLVYHDPDEFCQHLEYALENDPHPLDADTLR